MVFTSGVVFNRSARVNAKGAGSDSDTSSVPVELSINLKKNTVHIHGGEYYRFKTGQNIKNGKN